MKFGKDCVKYLEGQYAFIILDETQNQLFVARDHYGIIPLFSYYIDGKLLIASEIKSILATNLVKNKQLDFLGIAETLFFYGPIPPRTCFTNIQQLPPGFIGIYNLRTGKYLIEDRRDFQKKNLLKNHQGIKALLNKSVASRLQGDSVPGIYLSGGLDSAIIAYLVNKISKRRPVAFGIKFSEKQFDEGKYQNIVAKALKIPLIQVKVTPNDIVKNMIHCVKHAETPLIRTAPIPMYLLSKSVRKENIKYVLCGEGADELFFGYSVFLKNKASYEDKWPENHKYLNWFSDHTVRRHIEKSFKNISDPRRGAKRDLRLQEINTKLSQYLLTSQGDRMSMAHGVEQRFPYLDSHVSRFAFSLNNKKFFDQNGGKAILRNAFKSILPKSIALRRKQGYLAPDISVIIALLKNDGLRYFFKKEITQSVGIFNYKEIAQSINKISNENSINESDARMLLFVLTTHLLYANFMTDAAS